LTKSAHCPPSPTSDVNRKVNARLIQPDNIVSKSQARNYEDHQVRTRQVEHLTFLSYVVKTN
jgi:hypothetical protein